MGALILVVEDEHIVARDIKTMLEGLAYTAETAGSGEEALKKAADLRPDLILMDIVLKGDMDGIDAAALVRDRLQIPVIYLTAHADERTVQRAKLTAPYGYILKPFEERELYITIELALFRHGNETKKAVEGATLEPLDAQV
jgi:CheY-like chemotaxis protein